MKLTCTALIPKLPPRKWYEAKNLDGCYLWLGAGHTEQSRRVAARKWKRQFRRYKLHVHLLLPVHGLTRQQLKQHRSMRLRMRQARRQQRAAT